jgi:hypothetical protein
MLQSNCRLSGSGIAPHVSNNLAPLPILATCLLLYLLKYLLFKNYLMIIYVPHTYLNFCEHQTSEVLNSFDVQKVAILGLSLYGKYSPKITEPFPP